MVFLLYSLTTVSSYADQIDVRISGMVCGSCESKIAEKLDSLPFVENTKVSFDDGRACAELSGEMVEADVISALEGMNYTVAAIAKTDACLLSGPPRNWADVADYDAQVISRGEPVVLEDHRVGSKFTVYDFGAPWCAPCHGAEILLKQYMSEHPDVAVRAVVLDAANAVDSFDMPAAKQHLTNAPGLPYFVVVSEKGKTIYRGSELPKALKQMDKRR